MPRAKRPAENPAQTPTRVPKHGRGRLRIGGTNKGGPGRPPEALRMASREVFAQWLAWAAKQMADPDQLDPATLNVIGNTAAKYGLGTTITPTDTEGKTLNSGVLAVPVPVGAAQWGEMAVAQQAKLAERPPLAPPADAA